MVTPRKISGKIFKLISNIIWFICWLLFEESIEFDPKNAWDGL